MKKKTQETQTAATIPTTTRQAYKMLDEMLSADDIRTILSRSKDDFVTKEHFGLGMWIRNNWIYGSQVDFLQPNGIFVLCDPDMMSAQFLEKYYDHLKRMNILL